MVGESWPMAMQLEKKRQCEAGQGVGAGMAASNQAVSGAGAQEVAGELPGRSECLGRQARGKRHLLELMTPARCPTKPEHEA